MVPDNEGIELPTIEEAKKEARRMANLFKREPDAPPASIVIEDESGAIVFTVTLWK
jgi:hypothetical protein